MRAGLPVEAISLEADIPVKWKNFSRVNAEFFAGLGSPGRLGQAGKIGRDRPVVATLPPQR